MTTPPPLSSLTSPSLLLHPSHHFPSLTPAPTTNMAAKSDGAPVSPQDEAPPERPPRAGAGGQRYTLRDFCWTLCALLVFFSDGASDLWLAADYYLRREFWCFSLTLVFVVVPSLVVQVLSFRWFAFDFSETVESSTVAAAVVAAASGGEEAEISTKDSVEWGAGRAGSGGGVRGCCRALVWFFQALVHVLQLAQVWR